MTVHHIHNAESIGPAIEQTEGKMAILYLDKSRSVAKVRQIQAMLNQAEGYLHSVAAELKEVEQELQALYDQRERIDPF